MSTITGKTVTQSVTLTNNTAASYPAYVSPLTITSTGTVKTTNANAIYGPTGYAWSVSNQGVVLATGATGDGVTMQAGGYVGNGGLIQGYNGIQIAGAAGTISNTGTISGTGTAGYGGVQIYGGTVVNSGSILSPATAVTVHFLANGTLNNTGYIGSGGVYFDAAGTAVNAGRIVDASGVGVRVSGGGTVLNTGTIISPATAYTVEFLFGSGFMSNASSGYVGSGGVLFNQLGTLVNAGRVAAIGTAVKLYSSGIVTNTGTISGSGAGGVGIVLTSGGTVTNSGTISGAAGTAVRFGAAGSDLMRLAPGYAITGKVVAGGTSNELELLSGASTGTVSGIGNTKFTGFTTVAVDSGASWVLSATNTIASGVTVNLLGTLTDLGTLTNAGKILGGSGTLVIDPASLINSGYISGTVTLSGGGTVNNQAGGTIKSTGIGVFGTLAAATVSNAGTILGGTGSNGIDLVGGRVSNASGGLIEGAYGVNTQNVFSATVTNYGSIIGTTGKGVYLAAGDSVTNGSGGVIQGSVRGVEIGRGFNETVDNSGTIIATTDFGAVLNVGSVNNRSGGLIKGGSGGVNINSGNLVNAGTVVGSSGPAVYIGSSAGSVTNSGSIIGNSAFGVELKAAGSVNNTGIIRSTLDAVVVYSSTGSTVTNSGTIQGTSNVGVYLAVGGNIINNAGGRIEGGGRGIAVYSAAGTVTNAGTILGTTSYGVQLKAGGTIVDSGTISGVGAAINFGTGGSGNLLVLEHGYKITGNITAGVSATNTVELAGSVGNTVTASLNGLGLTSFQDVLFGSGGFDTLKVTNTSGTVGPIISGFTLTSDVIDLTGIASGAITQIDNVNHRVTVSGVGGTVTFKLDTSDATNYTVAPDGSGGTDLLVCFCRGTRILTERGEVPVEMLAVGDRVKTWSGAVKPIKWIGFGRDLVTRRHTLARPIIVKRGALADNVPARDLYLTHGHALYVDGVLIAVENLVNHRSIVWDETARVVEYYHIELADHDVVFADGAPAETYYDAANRAQFHNTRPGSQEAAAAPTFASVVNGGAVVERIWAKLFERSGGTLVRNTTADPDLHLAADGARLAPEAVEDGRYTFAFAAPPADGVHIRSRSSVPSLVGTVRHDHRRLGVAIRRIELRDATRVTTLTPDSWLFRDGDCHPPELGYVWTDGDLALPAALFAHLVGAFTLTIDTERPGMRYPLPAPAAA